MEQFWHSLQYLLLSVLVQFQPLAPEDVGRQAQYQLMIGEEDWGRLEVVVEDADSADGVSGFVLRSDYVAGDAPSRWLRARFLDYGTHRVVDRVGDASMDYLAEPATLPPFAEAAAAGFTTPSPLIESRPERVELLTAEGDTLRVEAVTFEYEVSPGPDGERLHVAVGSTHGVLDVAIQKPATNAIVFRLVPGE